MLGDRHAHDSVVDRLGIRPLNPRERVLSEILARPLRVDDVEKLVQLVVQLHRVVSRAAHYRGRYAVAAVPEVLVKAVLVERVVNLLHRRGRVALCHEADFRHVPACVVVLLENLAERHELLGVDRSVVRVERQKIDARRRQHLAVARDDPLVV